VNMNASDMCHQAVSTYVSCSVFDNSEWLIQGFIFGFILFPVLSFIVRATLHKFKTDILSVFKGKEKKND